MRTVQAIRFFALGSLNTVVSAPAQQSLIVFRTNGIPGVVRAVALKGGSVLPEVSNFEGSAIHAVANDKFELVSSAAWSPGVINVEHLAVRVLADRRALHLAGDLKADRRLSECFILVRITYGTMDVQSHRSQDALYLFYPLDSGSGGSVMPTEKAIAFDHYWPIKRLFDDRTATLEIHFFSSGWEVPSTLMKPEALAAAQAAAGAYVRSDHPPFLIEAVQPAYPSAFRGEKVKCLVSIRCLVGANGNVDPDSAEIISTPDMALADAAREAVSKWVFVPAIQDGEAVIRQVDLRVPFYP